MDTNQDRVSPSTVSSSDGVAYVDGAYVPVGEAKLPILDWGFTSSDVTYDVVHVWKGAFFRLDDHLDRFERSCKALRLRPVPPINIIVVFSTLGLHVISRPQSACNDDAAHPLSGLIQYCLTETVQLDAVAADPCSRTSASYMVLTS